MDKILKMCKVEIVENVAEPGTLNTQQKLVERIDLAKFKTAYQRVCLNDDIKMKN